MSKPLNIMVSSQDYVNEENMMNPLQMQMIQALMKRQAMSQPMTSQSATPPADYLGSVFSPNSVGNIDPNYGMETFNPNSPIMSNGAPDFSKIPSDFSTPSAMGPESVPNMGGYAAAGLLGNMFSQQGQESKPTPVTFAQNNQPQGPQRQTNAYDPYMAQGLLNRRRNMYGI